MTFPERVGALVVAFVVCAVLVAGVVLFKKLTEKQ